MRQAEMATLAASSAASSASSPESQSSYDEPEKRKCRVRLIAHAVKHLTTERDTSVCVQRDHVRKLWHQLRETKKVSPSFFDEEIPAIEEEISQWELFHKSQVQTREPSDLRVCYLAGDDPTNDLKVLVNLGILPQNVWAVEKKKATLKKAWESISCSNLRNVRLFGGDIIVFLKDFEGQFDIIYFDACGTLPAAKQETLKFIGYVFLFNKLTSPGALITNFSFPPPGQQQQAPTQEEQSGQDFNAVTPDDVGFSNEAQKAKPADPQRCSIKELSVGYLKYRLTNTLNDKKEEKDKEEEMASKLNLRTDEENYGDYITYQVIDSAYLYIPIQRMLMATKLEAVSSESKAATGTDLNSQSTSDKITEHFFEIIKKSYLLLIALFFQKRSPTNNLCKAWITELFPVMSMENQDIASLLKTHLSSYSFIMKFANENMKKFCGVTDTERPISMVTGLLYGQMANPSFPVVDKLLRLCYTAKKRQMFSDVFIFDKCRYVYEQFPTVDTSIFALCEPNQPMVSRMVVDGLCKHLGGICVEDIFLSCNVASLNAMVDGGGRSLGTARQKIPERQRMEKLISESDKLREEGNALVKEEKYEEAIALYDKCCDLWPTEPKLYTNRAFCFLKLNKLEDTLSNCNKALELDPRNVKALYHAGMAHKKQSKYSDAEKYFQKILTIDKKNRSAYQRLCECERNL